MVEISDSLNIPEDPRAATKHLLDKLLTEIHPLISGISNKIYASIGNESGSKINEVYSLCWSQISKCLLGLFEIFRLEYSRCTILQESRQCNLERLSWCINRLHTIDKFLDRNSQNISRQDESANESLNVTTMYFVNWIDHAFENLNKLSTIVYKTDYKESETLYELWKSEMVECISGLHISIDELLLCAMTLCRYCLNGDQHVIKARCQVVLRETKSLLSEIVQGDVSSTIKATTDSLKLPVKPSNVNVTIDVLKDALYVLETNTNTALLGLLIHCFSTDTCPVDVLKGHLRKGCDCVAENEDVSENCNFVKDFDLYNERLLQIGSYAVSCSSDQNRILSLRSGLASLEVLDPHLVPALMTSPDGYHSTLLIKSWRQEVQDIRDGVFLIVDPAAFAEKSKQMLHQRVLEVLREESYNNAIVCSVIRIGCVVHDFFNVYIRLEPDALTHTDKLLPLLADLEKVQLECKIVSNLLSSATDFTYDIKMSHKKTASLEQLYKRLKLLYTLVNRINSLLQPSENDQLFDEEDEPKNITYTIAMNETYVNSPRKNNISRSMFARPNVRPSTRNVSLSKLTKHLRVNCAELNFSVQLDELFHIAGEKSGNTFVIKRLDKVRESSVLYNFSPIKNRSSLRKVVLNRHLKSADKDVSLSGVSAKESLFNEDESLQLTEAFNEINNITSILSTPKSRKALLKENARNSLRQNNESKNVLKINIDNQNAISKHIWNIPVNSSTVEISINESLAGNASNVTQPSSVTTLERMTDLDFVEARLDSLKSQMETSL